jgi:hypothetical protein
MGGFFEATRVERGFAAMLDLPGDRVATGINAASDIVGSMPMAADAAVAPRLRRHRRRLQHRARRRRLQNFHDLIARGMNSAPSAGSARRAVASDEYLPLDPRRGTHP